MPIAETATTAAGRLKELPCRLRALPGFAGVLAELTAGGAATLDGVWGSGCALVAAALAGAHTGSEGDGPLVIVFPHGEQVDAFCDDLRLFTETNATQFPALEAVSADEIARDPFFGQRLRVLKELDALDGTGGLGATGGLSASGGSGPRNQPAASARNSSAGLPPSPTARPKRARAVKPPVPRRSILATSIQALVQPVSPPEELTGHTRLLRRGDETNLDELIAWLGDEGFKSTTVVQRPGQFSKRGGILDLFAADWEEPVRVEFFGDEVESIRRFDVVTQRSLDTLDAVDLTVIEPNERADKPKAHLADHLPDGSWFLLVEPQELQEEGRRYLNRLSSHDAFHSVSDVLQRACVFPSITAERLAAGSLDSNCHLPLESIERFSGDVSRVKTELDETAAGQDVFVVCQTRAEAARLEEIFAGSQLAAEGRLHYPIGRLEAGFRYVPDALVFVSAAELFQRSDLSRRGTRPAGRAIDTFLDLRENDLVVHVAHGVARYLGLKLIEKPDHVEEFLELEFHGGTKILVPASKIDLVQKYVGGTKKRPNLARIGGKTWARQKEMAERAVMDMASDLLQLQAVRAARPGIAFAGGSEWQREFEASFPYTETPDQLSAVEAVTADMERPTPADRLICGDVGYGKTEVAMRAAFKAVDNGYQVAVLVPTTVLAEQHYRTFRARMAEYPFDIARLSRFCSDKEQREIVEKLKDGSIDICIGTHRLAQADIQLANLGLLIIDEEQRFGVDVKERLKKMRQVVDVLTLTATPIPRTLHMSLLGLRDISNLETPPADRLAVQTRVTRFDEQLVRSAILRELNREGQVFFVHNRVHDIERLKIRLEQIVPEARIGIGHGQMPEGQLERVMLDFVNRKFDVLLATTIIESGLDIPNANTIFIDEADIYGLADLHQLRGRVGRYKHRAYAYLLVDPNKSLNPAAARRLRAIEEFSEMGAGFAIAMRDLEIRGAGNILGTEQSGHINAVGYELYCQLLDAAVRRLKQLPADENVDVTISLPAEAYLPRDYVPNLRQKIELYRRLGRVRSEQALAEFGDELKDRFGAPPPAVQRLLHLMRLRLLAAKWGIDSIHQEDQYLALGYRARPKIDRLARASEHRLRVVDDRSAYLPLRSGDNFAETIEELEALLRLTPATATVPKQQARSEAVKKSP